MAQSLRKMLYKDWQRIAESVVKKRGRKLDDLRFAKRTTHGYAFFLTKKVNWDLLHEITREVAHLFPHVEFALVAEACSELFNSEDQELLAA